MSIQVRDSKAYGGGYYLVIETLPEMEEPYLYTSEMFLDQSNLKHFGSSLVYRIPKSLDEKLHKDVRSLEISTEKAIRELDDETLSKLPEKCRNLITLRREDPNWQCVRPNYYAGGDFAADPSMFLKGNLYSIIVKDLNGNFLPVNLLSDGYYRFKLRACMVYMGEHKMRHHIANLQLRIVELNYSTVPFDYSDDVTPFNSPLMDDCLPPPTPKKRKTAGSLFKKPSMKRQNAVKNVGANEDGDSK